MQTWAELRADLVSVGYIELTHLEIECDKHGAWRLGVLTESEFRPACPKCGTMCDAAELARGLSRQQAEWKCVSPALSDTCKALREDPIFVVKCRQATRRRRPEFLARARRELQEVLPVTTRIRQESLAVPRPRNHKATPEEMRRRLVLIAELLVRQESPQVIEATLGLPWPHLKVTICRNRQKIESVMRTLGYQGGSRNPVPSDVGRG